MSLLRSLLMKICGLFHGDWGVASSVTESRSGDYLVADLGGGVELRLRLIPAGGFMMGAVPHDKEAVKAEKPRHRVEISKPFYIGVYEVTQAQYERVMGKNPSRFKSANRPVECVSWNDAVEFCRKLSEKAEEKYRLPTEAEWEYACRAGTETRYYWGDDDSTSTVKQYTWNDHNSGGQTHEVGQKRPNAWDLYDMSGNVWEWCQDWDADDYYSSGSTKDPKGPPSGRARVLRGGSLLYGAWRFRSSYRCGNRPDSWYVDNGFRVVRDVE